MVVTVNDSVICRLLDHYIKTHVTPSQARPHEERSLYFHRHLFLKGGVAFFLTHDGVGPWSRAGRFKFKGGQRKCSSGSSVGE